MITDYAIMLLLLFFQLLGGRDMFQLAFKSNCSPSQIWNRSSIADFLSRSEAICFQQLFFLCSSAWILWSQCLARRAAFLDCERVGNKEGGVDSMIYIRQQQQHVMLDNLIKTIPPVTRAILFLLILGVVLTYTNVLHRYDMYFSLDRIAKGEVWRLVTSIFFLKDLDLSSLYKSLIFLYVSSSIEKNGFKRGSVDYLYFTCICLSFIYCSAVLFGISSLTGVYLYSLYYYFGRIHTERLIIINFIPIRAPYCLWFLLAIEWLTGEPSLYNDLLGLFIGHCLYFMLNVYEHLGMCREGDRKTFDTPQILYMIVYCSVDLVSHLFNERNRMREQADFDFE